MDYTQFACPNSNCKMHARFGEGNIAHHSWIGKSKNINRLRCKICKITFSENRCSLRERAKIPAQTQEKMLKCFRWGVPDEGISDICEVNLKTVSLFREKVAKHAQKHHDNFVKNVEAKGIQIDEIRAKQSKSICWCGIAMVMQSYLILAVALGARNQILADSLLAEIFGRCRSVGIILSDGWRCYYSAILRCFGFLYRPRNSNGGRKKLQRFKFGKSSPFYAQVIKQTTGFYRLCAVKSRAIIGSLEENLYFMKVYGLGRKINTSHIERLFGTLRCHTASLRRKSRCFGRNPLILSDRIWIFVALHNWILPHSSLSRAGKEITPAMAVGLIDRPMSYRDYIRLPIINSGKVRGAIDEKFREMRSDESMKAGKRTGRRKYQEHILWRAPVENLREAA